MGPTIDGMSNLSDTLAVFCFICAKEGIGYFLEVFLDLFLQTRIWVFAESLRQEVCAADLSEQLMGVLLHKLLAKIR